MFFKVVITAADAPDNRHRVCLALTGGAARERGSFRARLARRVPAQQRLQQHVRAQLHPAHVRGRLEHAQLEGEAPAAAPCVLCGLQMRHQA
jgi:hypothetical protein